MMVKDIQEMATMKQTTPRDPMKKRTAQRDLITGMAMVQKGHMTKSRTISTKSGSNEHTEDSRLKMDPLRKGGHGKNQRQQKRTRRSSFVVAKDQNGRLDGCTTLDSIHLRPES